MRDRDLTEQFLSRVLRITSAAQPKLIGNLTRELFDTKSINVIVDVIRELATLYYWNEFSFEYEEKEIEWITMKFGYELKLRYLSSTNTYVIGEILREIVLFSFFNVELSHFLLFGNLVEWRKSDGRKKCEDSDDSDESDQFHWSSDDSYDENEDETNLNYSHKFFHAAILSKDIRMITLLLDLLTFHTLYLVRNELIVNDSNVLHTITNIRRLFEDNVETTKEEKEKKKKRKRKKTFNKMFVDSFNVKRMNGKTVSDCLYYDQLMTLATVFYSDNLQLLQRMFEMFVQFHSLLLHDHRQWQLPNQLEYRSIYYNHTYIYDCAMTTLCQLEWINDKNIDMIIIQNSKDKQENSNSTLFSLIQRISDQLNPFVLSQLSIISVRRLIQPMYAPHFSASVQYQFLRKNCSTFPKIPTNISIDSFHKLPLSSSGTKSKVWRKRPFELNDDQSNLYEILLEKFTDARSNDNYRNNYDNLFEYLSPLRLALMADNCDIYSKIFTEILVKGNVGLLSFISAHILLKFKSFDQLLKQSQNGSNNSLTTRRSKLNKKKHRARFQFDDEQEKMSKKSLLKMMWHKLSSVSFYRSTSNRTIDDNRNILQMSSSSISLLNRPNSHFFNSNNSQCNEDGMRNQRIKTVRFYQNSFDDDTNKTNRFIHFFTFTSRYCSRFLWLMNDIYLLDKNRLINPIFRNYSSLFFPKFNYLPNRHDFLVAHLMTNSIVKTVSVISSIQLPAKSSLTPNQQQRGKLVWEMKKVQEIRQFFNFHYHQLWQLMAIRLGMTERTCRYYDRLKCLVEILRLTIIYDSPNLFEINLSYIVRLYIHYMFADDFQHHYRPQLQIGKITQTVFRSSLFYLVTTHLVDGKSGRNLGQFCNCDLKDTQHFLICFCRSINLLRHIFRWCYIQYLYYRCEKQIDLLVSLRTDESIYYRFFFYLISSSTYGTLKNVYEKRLIFLALHNNVFAGMIRAITFLHSYEQSHFDKHLSLIDILFSDEEEQLIQGEYPPSSLSELDEYVTMSDPILWLLTHKDKKFYFKNDNFIGSILQKFNDRTNYDVWSTNEHYHKTNDENNSEICFFGFNITLFFIQSIMKNIYDCIENEIFLHQKRRKTINRSTSRNRLTSRISFVHRLRRSFTIGPDDPLIDDESDYDDIDDLTSSKQNLSYRSKRKRKFKFFQQYFELNLYLLSVGHYLCCIVRYLNEESMCELIREIKYLFFRRNIMEFFSGDDSQSSSSLYLQLFRSFLSAHTDRLALLEETLFKFFKFYNNFLKENDILFQIHLETMKKFRTFNLRRKNNVLTIFEMIDNDRERDDESIKSSIHKFLQPYDKYLYEMYHTLFTFSHLIHFVIIGDRLDDKPKIKRNSVKNIENFYLEEQLSIVFELMIRDVCRLFPPTNPHMIVIILMKLFGGIQVLLYSSSRLEINSWMNEFLDIEQITTRRPLSSLSNSLQSFIFVVRRQRRLHHLLDFHHQQLNKLDLDFSDLDSEMTRRHKRRRIEEKIQQLTIDLNPYNYFLVKCYNSLFLTVKNILQTFTQSTHFPLTINCSYQLTSHCNCQQRSQIRKLIDDFRQRSNRILILRLLQIYTDNVGTDECCAHSKLQRVDWNLKSPTNEVQSILNDSIKNHETTINVEDVNEREMMEQLSEIELPYFGNGENHEYKEEEDDDINDDDNKNDFDTFSSTQKTKSSSWLENSSLLNRYITLKTFQRSIRYHNGGRSNMSLSIKRKKSMKSIDSASVETTTTMRTKISDVFIRPYSIYFYRLLFDQERNKFERRRAINELTITQEDYENLMFQSKMSDKLFFKCQSFIFSNILRIFSLRQHLIKCRYAEDLFNVLTNSFDNQLKFRNIKRNYFFFSSINTLEVPYDLICYFIDFYFFWNPTQFLERNNEEEILFREQFGHIQHSSSIEDEYIKFGSKVLNWLLLRLQLPTSNYLLRTLLRRSLHYRLELLKKFLLSLLQLFVRIGCRLTFPYPIDHWIRRILRTPSKERNVEFKFFLQIWNIIVESHQLEDLRSCLVDQIDIDWRRLSKGENEWERSRIDLLLYCCKSNETRPIRSLQVLCRLKLIEINFPLFTPLSIDHKLNELITDRNYKENISKFLKKF
ncbi:hypothetical protein SNEBB_006467 [Seison nebaliae]|nr:hypothetical protein SNEBB_006467 [Seison nebaliae]